MRLSNSDRVRILMLLTIDTRVTFQNFTHSFHKPFILTKAHNTFFSSFFFWFIACFLLKSIIFIKNLTYFLKNFESLGIHTFKS